MPLDQTLLPLVKRELVVLIEADRGKPPADFLGTIHAVISKEPHARLVRDGVGDTKFTISLMGTSQVLGAGQTGVGAWTSAHRNHVVITKSNKPC